MARPGNGIALVGQTVKRRVMFGMTFFVGMTSRRIREKLFGNNSPNVTLFGIVFKRHPNSIGNCDLQIGDKKVTLNHLVGVLFAENERSLRNYEELRSLKSMIDHRSAKTRNSQSPWAFD